MKFAVTAIALIAASFALPASGGPASAAVFAAPGVAASSAVDGSLFSLAQYYPAPAPFYLPTPPVPYPAPGYVQRPRYPDYGDGRRGDDEDGDGDAWRRRRARERWCYYHPGRC